MRKKFFLIVVIMMILTGCSMPVADKASEGTNYSNKKICWGFKKSTNETPPQLPSEWVELLKRYNGYYLGDVTNKTLYLTFDEGYENGYTSKILDVLKEENVPATFFITGPYLKTEGELVKRMVNEGHIVGNHTVNHPSMPDVSDNEKLKNELLKLNEDFFALTGENMKYIRPPKGEFSERTLALCNNMGYKTILWSSAYADWDVKKQKGTDYAVKSITSQFHNGNIILLHAVSEDNANGLREMIKTAKDMGYSFLSLENL